MAQIEFSVLTRACLQGRNPDEPALQRAIGVYEVERNAKAATSKSQSIERERPRKGSHQ